MNDITTHDAVRMLCESEETRLEDMKKSIRNHIEYDLDYVAHLARKAHEVSILVMDLTHLRDNIHEEDWDLQLAEWAESGEPDLVKAAKVVDDFKAWNA